MIENPYYVQNTVLQDIKLIILVKIKILEQKSYISNLRIYHNIKLNEKDFI